MKHKIILYATLMLLLVNIADAEKYFALDVNHILDSLAFNSISLREIDRTIKYADKSGYLVKTVSFENEDIKEIYYNMSENRNYLVYMPYDKNAAKILVYEQKNSIVMDIDVSSFADTCGNGICEPYESYESCTKDCKSGGKDDFCDEAKDGICDPDCPPKLDADCQKSKQNENISNQSVQSNQITNKIKNEELNAGENKGLLGYLPWILIGIGAILVILLAVIFFRKIKENRIIGILRPYIMQNMQRGFTLEQIKQVLFREGYSQKEVDRAIKGI